MAELINAGPLSNYELLNKTVQTLRNPPQVAPTGGPNSSQNPVTVKPAAPITTAYKPLPGITGGPMMTSPTQTVYPKLTDNEKTYLTNMIKGGTPGQVTWARNRLMDYYGLDKNQVDYIIPNAAVNAGYGAPVIANQQGLDAAIANNQIKNVGGTSPAGGGASGGGGAAVPTVGGAAPAQAAQSNVDIFSSSPYASGRMIGDIPAGPEYWTGQQQAENLGLIYDFANMLKLKQDAVNTQYANLDNEWGRTKDAYYDMTGTNADMLMGTLKRGDMAAARAGTASGTNAANQLSALLGLSQDASVGATDLAQQRADLVSEREAALAKASSDTLTEHNNLGTLLGNINNSKYNAENNVQAALIASLLGLDTAVLGNASAEKMNAAQIASAEKNAATAAAAQIAAAKSSGSGYYSNTGSTSGNVSAVLDGLYTAFETARTKGDTKAMDAIASQIYSVTGVKIPEEAKAPTTGSSATKPATKTIWEWLNELGAAASTPSGTSRRE